MNNTEQQSKRERWQAVIAEYETSGLSQVAFCKQRELSAAQFGYYLGLLKPKQTAPRKSSNSFVPVKINQQANIGEIRIILPNGFQCVLPIEIEAPRIKELIGVLLSC